MPRATCLDDSRGGSSHQPEVRRAAALDRLHSKSDRAYAATGRIELTREEPHDIVDASTDDKLTS